VEIRKALMKRFYRLLTVGLLAAALGGCVDMTVGRPIPGDQIKLVREGLTTKTEVRELFGGPLHTTKTESGEIWVYRHVTESACQELVVSFGEDDTVCVFTRDGV
jgi:outer membrane protein assembly factor BamE (lipoprotein component of BamABCDE complex)